MPPTSVSCRHEADRIVATLLLRRVTGDPSEDGLWHSLSALVTPDDARTLVIDAGQVQHFSSAALGRLVTLAKHCRDCRSRVVVRNLCPSLQSVFRLLRLEAVLEIEPGERSEGGFSQ